MKLGTRQIGSVGQSTGFRRSEMNPSVRPDSSGLEQGVQALAGSVQKISSNMADAATERKQETDKQNRFKALAGFSEYTGNYVRAVEDLKQNAPPDGAGVGLASEKLYNDSYATFIKTLPEELHGEFNMRGTSFFQEAATQLDGWERASAQGYATTEINSFVEAATIGVYENPMVMGRNAAELIEMIDASPLPEAEKEKLRQNAYRKLTIGSVAGQIREGGSMLFTSQPVTQDSDLVQAVRFVESGSIGPTAESGKGAAGLMQVLENDSISRTGTEIAGELRDRDFPVNGTEEERRAYLKDPEVSMRYGTHYLNKMLRRYKGDVEVALMAYNGGMKRADAFLNAGRDYSVLPEETRQYVVKVFDKFTGGKSAIPIAVNSVSAHLSFDSYTQLVQLAENSASKRRQLSEVERQVAVEDFTNGVEGPYQDMRKDIFAGLVPITQALEQVDVMLAESATSMTPKEQAALRLNMVRGLQIAEQARVNSGSLINSAEDVNSLFGDAGSSLTVEELLPTLMNEAASQGKAQTRALEEADNERKIALDDLLFRIENDPNMDGATGAGLIVDAHNTGLIPAGERAPWTAKLTAALDKRTKDERAREDLSRKVASGFIFGPTDARDLDKLIPEGMIDKLNASSNRMEISERNDLALSIQNDFTSMGVLPSQVSGTLKQLAVSPNWEDQKFGLAVMARLQETNPEAFSATFGTTADANVQRYRTLRNSMTESQLVQRYEDMRNPVKLKGIAANAQLVQQELTKLDQSEIRQRFDETFLGFGNEASFISPAAGIVFFGDYATRYETFRPMYDSAEDTQEAVLTAMKKDYGLTQGGSLIKYPPEKLFPTIDGGHEWLTDQVLRQSDTTFSPDTEIMIMPERNADELRRNGRPMQYIVTVASPGEMPKILRQWTPNSSEAYQARNELLEDIGLSPTVSPKAVGRIQQLLKDISASAVDKSMALEDRQLNTSDLLHELETLRNNLLPEERAAFGGLFQPLTGALDFAVPDGLFFPLPEVINFINNPSSAFGGPRSGMNYRATPDIAAALEERLSLQTLIALRRAQFLPSATDTPE
jgi:HPt (histidine-containing phosphotransfer) domain-containing protein